MKGTDKIRKCFLLRPVLSQERLLGRGWPFVGRGWPFVGRLRIDQSSGTWEKDGILTDV